MTPAARVAAAIDCLDLILAGEPAEKVLTTWARRSRFAGSGDRRAIRDLVFDGLRRRRSLGWIGGGDTGRAIMIGWLKLKETDPAEVFTGEGYAPSKMSELEINAGRPLPEAPPQVRLDAPDWLWDELNQSLGVSTEAALSALQDRAPVFVRVNRAKATRDEVQALLAESGINSEPHELSPTALKVTENALKIGMSAPYLDGLIELQDAASQAIVDRLAPHLERAEVLDYCAGGGGKSLAMAAYAPRRVVAYDVNEARMDDIPARAARAGVDIEITAKPAGAFDLVFCDCPCSSSGAWRRQPEAKWRLSVDRLRELNAIQDEILDNSIGFVREGGVLVYATCSILRSENEERIVHFLDRHRDWEELISHRLTPLDGGDGFFVSLLARMR